MKSVIFILLSSVCLLFNVVGAADCISCVNCINGKAPNDNGQYIIYTNHFNSCDLRKDSASFQISAQDKYPGCGYAVDINNLYQQCANECSTCQKTDNTCSAFGHASSTVTCGASACAKRGERPGFSKLCCDGLQLLDFHCIDPKQDCTPCGHRIEANKPCCDSSGINADGYWKCSNPFAGCHSCKFDSACGNKRCINGCCS